MHAPFFSVIIPAYNPSTGLLKILKKLYEQSFTDFEVIICDDGSDIDVKSLIEDYLLSGNLLYIRQENGGPASARQNGASHASGVFLIFLDADDFPSQTWLADFKKMIDEGHKLVCCNVISYTLKRPIREIQIGGGKVKFNYLAGAFAVQKEIYEEVGGYDPVLRYGENWELGFRLLNYADRNSLQIGVVDDYNLQYNREMDEDKFQAQSVQRASTCEYLYRKYKDSNRVTSKQLLQWVEMAAVNYSRSGDYKKSREFMLEAINLNPRKAKNYVRYVIAMFPIISNKFWSRKSIQKSFGSKANEA